MNMNINLKEEIHMIICPTCGAQLQDGTAVCPTCGAQLAAYNAPPQPQPQQTYYQPQPQYAPPQYQQAPPQQQYGAPDPWQVQYQTMDKMNDVSTAKTLGIVSIIGAFVFTIVCWICGGIGLSKANEIIAFAKQTGNLQLLAEAESAKKLNKAGLIISFVFIGLGILAGILIAVIGAAAGLGALDNYY